MRGLTAETVSRGAHRELRHRGGHPVRAGPGPGVSQCQHFPVLSGARRGEAANVTITFFLRYALIFFAQIDVLRVSATRMCK